MIKGTLKPDMDWPNYGSSVERDSERTPGLSDEWMDDDPPAPSDGLALISEATRLHSDALRILAGRKAATDNLED